MTATGGMRRRGPTRGLVALAVACAWLATTTSPAGATHEVTVGQTRYSDGTTAKVASPGTTLTINASGLPRRASGVDGGVVDRYWLVTIGQRYTDGGNNIPCYRGFRFVDNVPYYQEPGGTIPNASFTVPSWVGPGQWEVCFYSQPFEYVTAPVLLTVP